jgi:Xaa-Pro dipeptidase
VSATARELSQKTRLGEKRPRGSATTAEDYYRSQLLGSQSRPGAHMPDEPLRAGMTVVIQPNVVTRDGRAGVQTGELVLITKIGIEPLHAMPRGFVRV